MVFTTASIIGIIIVLFLLTWITIVLIRGNGSKAYLKEQIEWLKKFFVEDKVPNSPSHKNLIGLSLTAVFCVAFLKTTVLVLAIQDIPTMWAVLFLGLLGIRAAQSYLEKKLNGTTTNKEKEDKP